MEKQTKKSSTANTESPTSKPSVLNEYDEILTRMAVEEIHREIAKKAEVVKEIGPSGWNKQSSPLKTNKRFLRNTLRSAVNYNLKKSAEVKFNSKNIKDINKGREKRLHK